jgi:succinyldiaminopimelate transaminase
VTAGGFVPPPYPYERLGGIKALADEHVGGVIDCSIGTPCDAPPAAVLDALSNSGSERGYPASAGSMALLEAGRQWMERRFDVEVPVDGLAACIGTKELVASVVHHLHLRQPDRTVVLYPEVSYPTYAMGAQLAGLEAVPVSMVEGRLDLASIDPDHASSALILWSNSPSNPTGALDDLGAAAAWGRELDVLVLSDECYTEFTWATDPQTILATGLDGVLAVHSLSKRSNLAGIRAGFYAGDPDVVGYLRSVRQHAGMMVPGPVQAAAAVALSDDRHVEEQRARYLERLDLVANGLRAVGYDATVPDGTFYLWVPVRDDQQDAWVAAEEIARDSGMLVSPGDLYGPSGAGHFRVAVVQPTDRLTIAMDRLASR